MRGNKFFAKKVYIVPGSNHRFRTEHDAKFYCQQRGIPTEKAIGLIVNGYAKDVLNKLPMEFAVEAQKLLSITLEGSVG